MRIVAQLSAQGPQSIVRLTETTDKHLYVLEGARLARSVRAGRESIWELQPERLEEVRRCLDEISTQWDGALERLRALVEK